MNMLIIISYIFLFLSAIDSSYKIFSKKLELVVFGSVFGFISLYNTLLTDAWSSEFGAILTILPLLFFSEVATKKKQVILTGTTLISSLFFLRNLQTDTSLFFLIVLESILLLSLIKANINKNIASLFSINSCIRMILISIGICLELSSDQRVKIVELLVILALIIQYFSISFHKSSFKKLGTYGLNSFLAKALFLIIIPLLLTQKVKFHYLSLSYNEAIKIEFLLNLILILFLFSYGFKNYLLSKNKEVHFSDNFLISLPFLNLYLLTDQVSFELLSGVLLFQFLLNELYENQIFKNINKVLKNFLYFSPINPLLFILINSLNQINSTLLQVLGYIFIAFSMYGLYSKVECNKEGFSRDSNFYKSFLITLTVIVVIYIYEKV